MLGVMTDASRTINVAWVRFIPVLPMLGRAAVGSIRVMKISRCGAGNSKKAVIAALTTTNRTHHGLLLDSKQGMTG
jgi:hypothetical protein